MRPTVVRVMSGLSLVVVGLSLRASRHLSDAALGVQPSGVVGVTTAAEGVVPPVSSPPPSPTPSPRAATPSPAATRLQPKPRRTTRTTARQPPPTRSPSPRPVAPTKVTVNGAPAYTRYGPVQVQIDLRGGHIVAARAVEYPTDSNRDAEINSYAIPQLDDETVQADSDQIDTVSGATYTSDGYRSSLQSALDAAHRAGLR